ncbi:MAG: MmcQ/YjbR family DNA-binding protein [Pyrinomonadaceae bacterium]
MNIEELREICLSFPNATEDIKWGNDLCFSIGGKMFCAAGLDEASSQISFKCTPEKFAELTERDGVIPAPYVARYHWVAVERLDALANEELEDLISKSFLMVFQKLPLKVRSSLTKR